MTTYKINKNLPYSSTVYSVLLLYSLSGNKPIMEENLKLTQYCKSNQKDGRIITTHNQQLSLKKIGICFRISSPSTFLQLMFFWLYITYFNNVSDTSKNWVLLPNRAKRGVFTIQIIISFQIILIHTNPVMVLPAIHHRLRYYATTKPKISDM